VTTDNGSEFAEDKLIGELREYQHELLEELERINCALAVLVDPPEGREKDARSRSGS
jgi:hypothetical protein